MTPDGQPTTVLDMSEMQSEVIPPITLGMRMHAALVHAGLSVEEMAADMGASRSSLSRWLNDRGPVKTVVLKQWALRCGVSYDWLKSGSPTIPRYWGDSAMPIASLPIAS